MANHQSNIDPPLLFWVIPPPIALMGKKQVFSLPVIGSAMKLANFVRVDRENPEAAKASVEVALQYLWQGTSFLVYPEGSRSREGRLQRFKHGVFVLAIRGQVPIVPITVDGCDALMPKGKKQIYPGTVRVTIHAPVETRGLNVDDREQLAQKVRSIVASALPEDKRSVTEMGAEAAATMEGDLAL
jgi:1-acyl-sn-glycerol-3-phosphate acyltransferase